MEPQLNLIGLVVSDMSAALAFYRRLGLDVPSGAENEPHVEVALAGGLRIAWDAEDVIRSFNPDWSPVPGAGRIGLAFQCESPEQVDSVYADLVGAGYRGHLEPWDAVWGQRYASVLDPDGNGVDLFASRS